MTSKKSSTSSDSTPVDEFADLKRMLDQAPADFAIQSDDVVGYSAFEKAPIRCIPRSVKMFDSNMDKSKPSILIFCQLTAQCVVSLKKEDGASEGQLMIANKGDMVGVWGKPGMRSIRNLCGVEVWIKHTGEKDTGKPLPMKTFDVKAAGRGTRLPVEDNRKDSKNARTFMDISADSTTDENGVVPF